MLSGKEKLDVSGGKPLTLVLEEDGTEVDDEEYFRFLQPNSVFLLLQEGESWHPSGMDMIMLIYKKQDPGFYSGFSINI